MSNKIVLVTGAHGFLGRNVAKYFKEKGWTVFGLGHGKWSNKETKNWGVDEWVESEVSLSSLRKFRGFPDVIIHAAGKGSVGYSILHPEEDFEANVLSAKPVLEYMKLYCPDARLIYPSSVAVYGDVGDISIKENTRLRPVSAYGQNKKKAERLLESYSKKFDMNISIIRFFSLYGPGLRKQLFWDACEKIRKSDRKILFYGSGKETRDWLNINDASDLIYKVSQSKYKFEIINGASGERSEIREVLNVLAKEYGKHIKIAFSGRSKKGDPEYYHADISKALGMGWKPKIALKEGISEYVKYYKEDL